MNNNDKLLQKALLEKNASLTEQETRTLRHLLANNAEVRRKFQRMRSLLDAAQATQTSGQPKPPDGLTDKVMAHIAASTVSPAGSFSRPLSLQALSAQGLAYVFIAFALFYCVVGVSMHFALANATAPGLPQWIWHQPRIALLSALIFGLCGGLLLKRGRRVARLLYLMLTGYMLCLTANALYAQLTAATSAISLGLIAYLGGGLVICLFLGDLLRRLPQNGWHKTSGA